jgi:hypothetical protein
MVTEVSGEVSRPLSSLSLQNRGEIEATFTVEVEELAKIESVIHVLSSSVGRDFFRSSSLSPSNSSAKFTCLRSVQL